MVALSRITRQDWASKPSLVLINEISYFVKLTIRFEVTVVLVFAAITAQVEVIAVIKEQEFMNQIFFIIWLLPFGIQLWSFFVSLEKEDWSTFIKTLNLSITFHSFIENHCFAKCCFASSKFTSLDNPFLYLIPSFFDNMILNILSEIEIPNFVFRYITISFAVHGFLVCRDKFWQHSEFLEIRLYSCCW